MTIQNFQSFRIIVFIFVSIAQLSWAGNQSSTPFPASAQTSAPIPPEFHRELASQPSHPVATVETANSKDKPNPEENHAPDSTPSTDSGNASENWRQLNGRDLLR